MSVWAELSLRQALRETPDLWFAQGRPAGRSRREVANCSIHPEESTTAGPASPWGCMTSARQRERKCTASRKALGLAPGASGSAGYRPAGLNPSRRPLQSKTHGSSKNQLENSSCPVSSFFRHRTDKAQQQDQCREPGNGADQPERTFLKPMPLPAILGMLSTSDLNTTCEIKERLEISIGIAHSNAHQGFSLVVLHELKGGTSLFPLFHQQVQRERPAEDISFCQPLGGCERLKALT